MATDEDLSMVGQDTRTAEWGVEAPPQPNLVPVLYAKRDASNGYGRQPRKAATDGLVRWAPAVGKALYPWLLRPAKYYAKGK